MHEQNCDESSDADLDPRIQIELEKLNGATTKINSLELELDEANTTFRMLLNESIKKLKTLSKRLGSCIEKARPYYEALDIAKKAHMECQKAAVQYQRSNEIHQAAKETVALAEKRFLSKQHEWQFDNAWQEMLNHATMKVMEAETQKVKSEMEHQKRTLLFNEAEEKLQSLESKLRKSINKSRPYFEEKELCQKHLASQKEQLELLQNQVTTLKNSYATSLRKLEKISEEIHSKRGTIEPGVREPGVGAENDAIAEMDFQMFGAQYRITETQPVDSTCTKIINSTSPFFQKTALNQYYPSMNSNPGKTTTMVKYQCLDYDLDLDKCDLQSLGSISVTTSSALSDDEYVEETQPRLHQMRHHFSAKTDTPTTVLANNPKTNCQSLFLEPYKSTSLPLTWEKDVTKTIANFQTILTFEQNPPSLSSENLPTH